jgi:nucleolar protein 56
MYLKTTWFGVFLIDKKGIIKKHLFPKDPKKIANILKKIEKENILKEEKIISKGKKIIVNEKRLKKLGEYKPNDLFFKNLNINNEEFGFTNELMQKATLLLIDKKIEDKLKSKDLQIIQMVNALDDLIQTHNLLLERLNCWLELPIAKNKITPFKNLINKINNEIKRLENLIDIEVEKIAPNTKKIIGSLICARLISLAGGIDKLSMMPASTIQLLGAERALFRYKKQGGNPPKHGIIFQHKLINRSTKNIRGKIARLIATKLTISIKADVFTKRDISKTLINEIDNHVKKIKNL